MVAAKEPALSVDVAELNTEHSHRQRLQTFVRHLGSTAVARLAGVAVSGAQVFEQRHPRSVHLDAVRRALDLHHRAPVSGGSSDNWAKPLAGDPLVFLDAFATAVRRASALGRLGAVEVPPNVRAPYPSSPATAAWVGLGQPVPVSKGAFAEIILSPLLLASMVVATNETLKGTGPKAEAIFEALLINAAVTTADAALLDPAAAGVPEVSPRSLTNGAFSVPSSGATVAALNADLGLIADHMFAAGIPLARPVLILSPASALRLGGVSLPAPGGSLAVPIVTTPSARDQVVLLDASMLVFTDGGINVDLSGETSVEMSDTPTADGVLPADATGPMVSTWQANLTAFKLTQYLNWSPVPDAVGVVTGFGAVTP